MELPKGGQVGTVLQMLWADVATVLGEEPQQQPSLFQAVSALNREIGVDRILAQ